MWPSRGADVAGPGADVASPGADEGESIASMRVKFGGDVGRVLVQMCVNPGSKVMCR